MSTTDSEQVTWLTQEAYDRLKGERDQLVGDRTAMAAEINARREEGDLKENGGYHAAKEEQGKAEARIRQLEQLLRTAKVGEAPPDDGVVTTGMVVTVRFAGDDEDERFLIGSREIAATTDLQVYSPESAIGAALTGHMPGEDVTYETPTGAKVTVSIIDAKPFTG